VALTECGLVPVLLNLLRPIDKSAGVGYCARRNYIILHAAHILELVITQAPLGLNTFRETNGGRDRPATAPGDRGGPPPLLSLQPPFR
jgi:hypothetical protein